MNPGLLRSSSGHRLGIKLTRKLPSSKWVSLCVSKNSPGKLSHLAFAAIGSRPVNPNEGEGSASDGIHICSTVFHHHNL